MKPSFLATVLLHQFLSILHIAASDCFCDGNDPVEEIFFKPEDNTPLDQDCLKASEPALQALHNLAEPRLACRVTFRTKH